MSKNRLQQLADDLIAELDEFRKVEAVVLEAQSRLGTREPDKFELYALGGILHDVYQGAESICLHIAKEIDRKVPVGATWHRDLLDQMVKPAPKARPPVIRSETAALLEDYRKFRHVVRHVYGFKFDWSQVKPLLMNAVKTIDSFAVDIEQFTTFLRLMTGNGESDRQV